MKQFFTIAFLFTSVNSFAQRTPADSQIDFARDPITADVTTVISKIRTGIQGRVTADENNQKTDLTTAEYQLLISKADEKFQYQLYGEAEQLYGEVLKY